MNRMPADASKNLSLSDGSIIAAGWSAGSTPICSALAKYGSNGVLSTASAVSTGSGSAYPAEHSGIALQANAEKIVTAGWVSNGSDNDFFIARYNGRSLPSDSRASGPADFSVVRDKIPPTVGWGLPHHWPVDFAISGGKHMRRVGWGLPHHIPQPPRSGLIVPLDQRHFAQHDANFNITSITDANGQVAERYLYTPYGEVLPDWYLGGSWETLQGGTTQLGWTYLFQGRPLDSASGKYDFRERPYDAPTGRFTSADPLGYPDGASRYQAFGSNPAGFVDPMGLCSFMQRARQQQAAALRLGITSEMRQLAAEDARHRERGRAVLWYTGRWSAPAADMAYARRHGAVGTAGAAGAGQGLLNAANGLTDIAIDMANDTLQRFTFSLLPPIPKIDWSENKVTSRVGISEKKTAHLLSKVFGGQGLMLLLTVGLSSLAAGEAAAGKAAVSGTTPSATGAAKKPGVPFSEGKQALVDMAKADKRTGMTTADMDAYKQLNKELLDPFPSNKVRGPESHTSRGPHSQQPHGHVGPVDHIPITDGQ